MKKSSINNTKGRIVSSAWQLFYEQGYDNTTIEDIVERSMTSKGSFYHYFSGKDALLGSMATLFDNKYEELIETLDNSLSPIDKLIYFNRELFLMIENTVSVDLLSRMFSAQLTAKNELYLLDTNRTYYKLLRKIAIEGQNKGIFRNELSINDIVRSYAMFERGLMYDWCISNGNYSLYQYSNQILPLFLKGLCK